MAYVAFARLPPDLYPGSSAAFDSSGVMQERGEALRPDILAISSFERASPLARALDI
jgi:hypothetical protein